MVADPLHIHGHHEQSPGRSLCHLPCTVYRLMCLGPLTISILFAVTAKPGIVHVVSFSRGTHPVCRPVKPIFFAVVTQASSAVPSIPRAAGVDLTATERECSTSGIPALKGWLFDALSRAAPQNRILI